ncbi:hypothetical protein CASFOL_037905 [Castilleja foliolosa]|uniref:Uncharacterized protein n=1 Tax=Castilleja foliolosa TaxID=1961234 RepID=A0ABD3BK33_9LAMI
MGCGVSRLDGGNGMLFPAKLRPIFLYRLEEIKTRRHARPLKKELLLHDHDDDDKSTSSDKNAPNENMQALYPSEKHEEENGLNCKSNGKEKVIKGKDDDEGSSTGEETDGDDRSDDGRMIGCDDDGAFRGSPSFRVYFKDDGEEKHNGFIGQENDAISSDEAKSSKESLENKKVKKITRKKSSKKRVKNLLNYKSCYNKTPSSDHHQSSLLT